MSVPLLPTNILFIPWPKVIVPTFSGYFRRKHATDAWELLRNLLTTIGCGLMVICLLRTTFSSVIVYLQVLSLFHHRFTIQAVADGILLGDLAQLVVLALALTRDNSRYYWVIKPSDPRPIWRKAMRESFHVLDLG